MVIRGRYRIADISYRSLRSIITTLNMGKEFMRNDRTFMEFWTVSNKTDNPVTDAEESIVDRVGLMHKITSDRTFPLETVILKNFNEKHGQNIESATIHYGPGADEMARSINSMAFVIANDIYFRSNKFDPNAGEGQKLLAHELTHVAQNERNETKGKEELELEAEQAEDMYTAEDDPIETFELNGRTYQFKKSNYKKYAHKLAEKIERWLKEQKFIQDEKKYLRLLLAYKDTLRSYKPLWDTATKIELLISDECKQILKGRAHII